MEDNYDAIPGFLSGGGELSRLFSEFDWTGTPLGSIETWPQSLRTSVNLMLNSRHPMWIGWGTEITFLYNEAYIDVLSKAKHPWALGKPASVVWEEIWDVCGPLADKVFRQGEATFVDEVRLFMNRGDFLEETYYSFSYSPIRDENGIVAGLFCPSTETTPKVINARRLKTLSELSSKTLIEKTTSAACASAAKILLRNPDDIPFGILYLTDTGGTSVYLEQTIGIKTDSRSIAPGKISLDDTENIIWPVSRVTHERKYQVIDVGGITQLPRTALDHPVKEAIALPVISPGQTQPVGVFISGVNPSRKLDDEYITFFELLSNQIALAVQNARAAEEEARRIKVLAELNDAKSTFFTNISHEFRTPLTLMLGPLENLLQKKNAGWDAGDLERIETAHRNALRLLKLVNNLLDFSRLEAGKIVASYRKTDIAAFTKQLAESFRSTIEKEGLVFDVQMEPVKEPVYIDTGMWEKIVLNLLSNAFKNTLAGNISVVLKAGKNGITLHVKDTGIGIPAREMPNMFERFHRVKNAGGRSFEGTGIGLSLSSELVHFHGGEITVDSTEGQGSTFTVTVPYGKEHLPPGLVVDEMVDINSLTELFTDEHLSVFNEPAPGKEENKQHAAPGEGHKPLILVVDDNPDMRSYIISLLQLRYNTIFAVNGNDALGKIKAQMPDLVISDIMMPVMDGIQLVRSIKENHTTRNLPVILLSARAGEDATIEGYETGADDYLVKPFSSRELMARISAQLKIASKRTHVEKQLRNLFEQAPIAIAIIRGSNHVVELANERMFSLWGRKAEDVLNQPVFEAMPEVAGQGFEDLLDSVIKTGERFVGNEMPVRILRNGLLEDIFVKFVYEPLNEEDGSVSGVMVVADEITQQVKTTRKILMSEERMRMAIESTGLGTWDYNPATGELSLSNELLNIYGFKPGSKPTFDEVLGYVHPDDRDKVTQQFLGAVQEGRDGIFDMIFRINRVDGTGERWLRGQGKVFFNERGIAERYIGTNVDITTQKKYADELELKVKKRTRELKKINDELNLAQELARVGSWEWDVPNNKLTWSKNLYSIYGLEESKVITFNDYMECIHPDDKQFVSDKIKEAMDTHVFSEFTHRIVINGEVKTMHSRGEITLDESGNIIKMTGTGQDISKDVELTRQLELKNIELQKFNAELSSFTYIASHDLQEPLRKIQTFTGKLLETDADNISERGKEYFSRIVSAATRMQNLIYSLLNYSRLDSGERRSTTTDLNVLLDEVRNELSDVIEENHIKVEAGKLPVLSVVPHQFQQLFFNLLDNAIKYRRKNESLSISIKAERLNATRPVPGLPVADYWKLSFSDTGIGFEQQYADRIFGLFQRLHGKSEYSGTGIGLAICKKVVENHQGIILAKGEPDRGATFEIYLPA